MNAFRLFCLLVILAVSTFLYGGCSSFDSEVVPTETTSITQPPESGSTETQINPATARTGNLVVGVEMLPNELHPFYPKSQVEQWVVEGIFEGLVESDLEGKPVGRLADTFEISEDGLEYVFNIKDRVLFHDGTPMTLDDILFTFEAASNKAYEGAYAESFQAIEKVELLSDTSFKVTFTKSSIYHIWAFTIPILPEHVYGFEEWETFIETTNRFVGTGPLMWNAIEYNETVELVKNAFYHVNFDGIEKVVFKNMSHLSMGDALLSGAVDLAIINPEALSLIKKEEVQFVNIQEVPRNEYIYIGFNHDDSFVNDRRVRQALAYAFNRSKFIETSFEGSAIPMDGPVLGHHWTYPGDQALNDYLYDVEKAKSLLESSGWTLNAENGRWFKDATELKIPIYAFNDVDWSYDLSVQLQADWGLLGIDTAVHWMDFETLKQSVFEEFNASVWVMAWELPVDYDASRVFGNASNSLNAGNYQSEEANALFNRMRTAFDETERLRLTSEWVSLANDDLPYIFVAAPMDKWAINDKIENLVLSPNKSWMSQFASLKLKVME